MILDKLNPSMSREEYDRLAVTKILSERSEFGAVFTVGDTFSNIVANEIS